MNGQKKRLLAVACVLCGDAAGGAGRGPGGVRVARLAQRRFERRDHLRPALRGAGGLRSGRGRTHSSQTVQYVPQTYYRAAYVAVPVTAYQPVVAADPCTGCAVTTYRPVTAVTYQTRLVPYTSYRMVYANPCTPCASYS